MSISTGFLRAVCVAVAFNSGSAGRLVGATTNLDESIRQLRMGTFLIEAAPGAKVRVEQLRHEFWFGAALASQMFRGGPDGEEASRYKKVFLESFNAAVSPPTRPGHSAQTQTGG